MYAKRKGREKVGGHLFGSNSGEYIQNIEEQHTSISSNSFESSLFREEDVGIACWSVDDNGSVANTNSERVSSSGSTISG
jgi:hypothetical protein